MKEKPKTKEILIIIEEMNLGGTEKSFLTFLDVLSQTNKYKFKLLLLKSKGPLFDKIPNEVEVIILEERPELKKNIRRISLKGILNLFKQLHILDGLQAAYYYLLIKITGKWFLSYKYAYDKLNPIDTDVAIAFSGPIYLISWLVINKVNSKKKIQWIRFDINKFLIDSLFGKTFYPKFDKIYCVSQPAFQSFVKIYPEVKFKTETFNNIVSEDYIKKQADEGESFKDDFKGLRILTTGRLSGEKGQQMIPGVVKKLKEAGFDFRWYLIGDGYLRTEIENEIKNLKIEDHLILLGNQINPYPFFRDIDLYVQTSFHEGYCLTLHEAKIFEKPVVTTDFINASNLVVDGEDGLIVPIDPESIYSGVRDLIENEQKRIKYSRFLLKDEMQKPEALINLVESWFSE